MMLPLHDRIRTAVRSALTTRFELDARTADVPLEVPPSRAFGDVGSPVAFELARTLRKAPRAIAQELAAALGPIDGVLRVEAAPNGYLNVFLDRAGFLRARLAGDAAAAPVASGDKTIVEHTAINPNKAAHIGHLRNACLGDTLVRALRFRGRRVEVQNYIDDTGVQVADVVVGFRHLEGFDLDAVRRVADTTRFDYYCWDLYARVTEWYEADRTRLAVRAATLHDIEHGVDPDAAIGAFVADRIVRAHLVTMARLGIDYDLLTWEGDILRMRFWARAFERLQASGAVFLQPQGKLAGCWVMRIEEDETAAGEDTPAEDASEDDAEQREKVIVRSNGTVTYVGKDMAYQFWKLGLLGHDFHYRTFLAREDGRPLWATTSDPAQAETPHPAFGAAAATYNVIDVRQSYLQKLLKQALTAAGHAAEAARHTHFAYEMVALSHATARALGFAPPPGSDDAKRPFVEVSGRKGLGVKADDLLDRLVTSAEAEVARRNPEQAPAEVRRTAERIGVAAVRYFMVKYSRTKVIAFDIDEALSFEGESGPYLQYAAVRAQNILQKLRDRDGLDETALTAALASHPPRALLEDEHADRLWSLVLDAGRLDEVVETAIRTLELAVLAKFAFGLAQGFNALYHAAPILAEEREDVRLWRAAAIVYLRRQLAAALTLMGIDVPVRM